MQSQSRFQGKCIVEDTLQKCLRGKSECVFSAATTLIKTTVCREEAGVLVMDKLSFQSSQQKDNSLRAHPGREMLSPLASPSVTT